MNDTEWQAALDRLKEFAGQQRAADGLADKGSLDRAADMMKLYDEVDEHGRRRWALELEPPKMRRRGGRPVDPESFSRFTKWLGERAPLKGGRAYQLRAAHELQANYFYGVEIKPKGEWELRPLKWLIKNGHEKAVPDVWRDAADRAGGTPTESDVKAALAAWKKTHVTKQKSAAIAAATGPEAVRLELERLARQLMEQDPEQFLLGFDHIDEMANRRFARAEANVA